VERGRVFNIQRFSIHDGPGIRTTVFLKGCPLRCSWCHNPEGIDPVPEILVSSQRCIDCRECVRACPFDLPVPGGLYRPDSTDRCQVCGACADACPSAARQVVGREMSVAEVVAEVIKDRVFYDQSGGGITVSGGEPLQQADFLQQLLTACRREGLHTTVDTCGLASWSHFESILGVTDLFLYDLKHMDDVQHRRHTGASNRQIIDNLEQLAKTQARIWLRVPVIPGINDSADNVLATARLATLLEAVERVCLLPFHRLGEDKLRRLGRPSSVGRAVRPAEEHLEDLLHLVEGTGMTATIGG